jgi:hypothetical protein
MRLMKEKQLFYRELTAERVLGVLLVTACTVISPVLT